MLRFWLRVSDGILHFCLWQETVVDSTILQEGFPASTHFGVSRKGFLQGGLMSCEVVLHPGMIGRTNNALLGLIVAGRKKSCKSPRKRDEILNGLLHIIFFVCSGFSLRHFNFFGSKLPLLRASDIASCKFLGQSQGQLLCMMHMMSVFSNAKLLHQVK